MKVTLVAYGTRGDVQPLVCLGVELAARGHRVRLLTPRNGVAMARAAGLEVGELPLDVQQMLTAAPAQRMLASGRLRAFFRWLHEEEKAYLEALREALIEGTHDAQAMVCHPLVEDRCAAIAQARGIPLVAAQFFPLLPSRRFPSVFLAQRNMGPLNLVTHKLMLDMLWRLSREDVARLRRQLGLPDARGSHSRAIARGEAPALLAYSPLLAPAPDDWAEGLRPTGALTPSQQTRRQIGEAGLPPELESWLQAGPAPIFLGFGSMPVLAVDSFLAMIRGTLAALDMRAVLGAGWSELSASQDERIFSVTGVDHQSLLPRCVAAVHHGGSGTVHSSLAAGTPTLVCSVLADQPFWGRRCRELGVGDTFAFKRLNQRRLIAGIERVLTPHVRRAAQTLAERMAREDPLAEAVAIVERAAPGAMVAA
jgi:sterol 3beta-glucosyltransferase